MRVHRRNQLPGVGSTHLLQGRLPVLRLDYHRAEGARRIHAAHLAQVVNYLRATGSAVGLLFNFGAFRLECRRVIFSGTTTEVSEENPYRSSAADAREG